MARLLLLQRWGFRSKPVTVRDGRWVTHGYSATHAEGMVRGVMASWGQPSTRDVAPQLPRLVDRLAALDGTFPLTAIQSSALDVDLAALVDPGDLVYIDPPYEGTSGYAHDLPRAAVLDLAQRAHDLGARVAVSEAVPVRDDWRAVDLAAVAHTKRGSNSWQTSEWLTCSPLAVPKQPVLFGGHS